MRHARPEMVKKQIHDLPRQFLCSGDLAPETGIYRVFHAEHRLSHEVTVLKGQRFPTCSKCSVHVHFELVWLAPLAERDREFPVVLNSLPVLDEDDARAKSA
jgi:hypothetical protein